MTLVCGDQANEFDRKEQVDKEPIWRVLLHNDDVHTFDYVIDTIVSVVRTVTRKKVCSFSYVSIFQQILLEFIVGCFGRHTGSRWRRTRAGLPPSPPPGSSLLVSTAWDCRRPVLLRRLHPIKATLAELHCINIAQSALILLPLIKPALALWPLTLSRFLLHTASPLLLHICLAAPALRAGKREKKETALRCLHWCLRLSVAPGIAPSRIFTAHRHSLSTYTH